MPEERPMSENEPSSRVDVSKLMPLEFFTFIVPYITGLPLVASRTLPKKFNAVGEMRLEDGIIANERSIVPLVRVLITVVVS